MYAAVAGTPTSHTTEDHTLSTVVISDAGDPLQKLVRSPNAAGLVIVGVAPSAIAASQLGLHAAADLCLVIAPLLVGLVATIRRLSRERISDHIVVLTPQGEDRDNLLVSALASGADGWLSGDQAPVDLGRSLRSVVAGEPGVSAQQVSQLISALRILSRREVTLENGSTAGLTTREQQMLMELAGDTPTRAIAHRLAVSEGTVRWHSARLLKKLNVNSRQGLAAVMARNDLSITPLATSPEQSPAPRLATSRSLSDPGIDWRRLAPGELRIVRLVAQGLTNREVAATLFLSKHTVDSHLKSAFAKLNIRSRVELTRLLLTNEPDVRTT